MVINSIRLDEQGGKVEAQLELARPGCAAPGPRGDIEIIRFEWTFTTPIVRLRPGIRFRAMWHPAWEPAA